MLTADGPFSRVLRAYFIGPAAEAGVMPTPTRRSPLKSPLVPLLLGLAFIAGAVAIDVQQRALQRDEVRDIAALRVELDSVRSALAQASASADSVRLAGNVALRTYFLGRREYHVPPRQAAIDRWWTLTGAGTLICAVGALLVVVAAVAGRRARAA